MIQELTNIISYSLNERKKTNFSFSLIDSEKTSQALLSFSSELNVDFKINSVNSSEKKTFSLENNQVLQTNSITFRLELCLLPIPLSSEPAEELSYRLDLPLNIIKYILAFSSKKKGITSFNTNSFLVIDYFFSSFKLPSVDLSLYGILTNQTTNTAFYEAKTDFYQYSLAVSKHASGFPIDENCNENLLLKTLYPLALTPQELTPQLTTKIMSDIQANNSFIYKSTFNEKNQEAQKLEIFYKLGKQNETKFVRDNVSKLALQHIITKGSTKIHRLNFEAETHEFNEQNYLLFVGLVKNICRDTEGRINNYTVDFVLNLLSKYIFSPDTPLSQTERGFVVFFGKQSAGKSAFFKILHALGDYNVFFATFNQINQIFSSSEFPDVQTWLKCRFLILDELKAPNNDLRDLLKALIFKNEATINLKFKNPIRIPLNFTGFIAANKKKGEKGLEVLLEAEEENRRYLFCYPSVKLEDYFGVEKFNNFNKIFDRDDMVRENFLLDIVKGLKIRNQNSYSFTGLTVKDIQNRVSKIKTTLSKNSTSQETILYFLELINDDFSFAIDYIAVRNELIYPILTVYSKEPEASSKISPRNLLGWMMDFRKNCVKVEIDLDDFYHLFKISNSASGFKRNVGIVIEKNPDRLKNLKVFTTKKIIEIKL